MFRLRFERQAEKWVNFGWDHGRFGDYWSFVHLLTGIGAGIFISLADFPLLPSLIATIVLMVAYEIAEMPAGIIEDKENSLTDIIIGALGVIGTLYVQSVLHLTLHELAALFTAVVVINTSLAYWGRLHHIRKRNRRTK